jgi:hypothetical protein
MTANRLAYIDSHGKPQCVSCKSLADVPSEFIGSLKALHSDLELALECLSIFKGIPLPVAKAILRNIEPAHAAIDMAVRQGGDLKDNGALSDRFSTVGLPKGMVL